ncbi:MAG: PBP1A family penicillin-binding protein [Cyanobacteria bacterium SZAS LIN-5]|nr:PBP1A family penicillin-binding protein [Cyanobacteria bacterium SZAS LIN-5]
MQTKLPSQQSLHATRKPGRPDRRLIAAVIACILVLVAMTLAWNYFHDWNSVSLPDENVGLKFFDNHDRLICTLLPDKEYVPVPLGRVAKSFQQALIATEDRSFYHHPGVNPESIIRALLANARAGHVVQGGSTITQQLVKNLYSGDSKRTVLLKLREAVQAIELDRRYQKNKILESYLNFVYFGRGTWGIESAAERYFARHASDLDLAQSAYLAGIVNAPTRLSTHKADAISRQHEVLDNMVEEHYITKDAASKAKAEKLVFKGAQTRFEHNAYYLNYVVELLKRENFSDDDLWNKGTRVFTNLDTSAQMLAAQTLTQGIKKAPPGVSQGALVSLSVKDGAVLAMVGGVGSYDKSPWNRATSVHTAGSAFKPFVYLSGLQTGVLKPDTTIYDAPLAIDIPGQEAYSPKNFDGKYLGPITIRKALALSRNTCAVRVTQAVTPQTVAETATKAGITSKLAPTLALGLGASAVSPLDMANSYATLARGGVRITPSFIRRVESKDKKVLRNYAPESIQVFDPEPVAEIVDAMQDVVQKGTGQKAKLFNRPVAGKTGTADGARDIWFIGFTPDTVTAVWGGNDKNTAIAGNQVTGGTIMAGIWQNYMTAFYKSHATPPGLFKAPENPLAEEIDQIHFLPQPAGIFDKITSFVTGDAPPPAPAEPALKNQVEMPPLAPPIHKDFGTVSDHNSYPSLHHPDKAKKKFRFKKLFNKIINLF